MLTTPPPLLPTTSMPIIGHIFAGALCFADDMKLLSPTKNGLQKMIDICKEFGIEFDVNYNVKKTVAICFSRSKEMIQFDYI